MAGWPPHASYAGRSTTSFYFRRGLSGPRRILKQFLIIQTAFLGDAVLATALLEKLHACYPDAAIDLVVRKGNEGLFGAAPPAADRAHTAHQHPFLRTLFVWNKGTHKNRALFRLIGELRAVRYDHIINCQRFLSTGLMTVLARGGETCGFSKNPLSFLFHRSVEHHIPEPASIRGRDLPVQGTEVHEVDRLNALIAHLTDDSRPLPVLYPSARALEEAAPFSTGHYVCIAPASVWATKQWPEEKWIELASSLPATDRVLLLGAPGDVDLCTRIARAAGRGEVLAGRLSLLGTAVLMQGARMNYVNDSAPLHIASAMGAPVTAVFCSTVPAFGFGPLRPNGRVAQREEPLYCRPCGLHGHRRCPEGHFRCAHEIRVEQVR
jgi:heptosyltransferase II